MYFVHVIIKRFSQVVEGTRQRKSVSEIRN